MSLKVFVFQYNKPKKLLFSAKNLKFKEALLGYLMEDEENKQQYILTEEDLKIIKELMEARYLKWDWNYGASPKYSIQKTRRYPWGGLELRLKVVEGILEDCVVFEDFFSSEDLTGLTEKLKGIKYREVEVAEVIKTLDLSIYFKGIEEGDFLECMFE